LYRQHLIGAKGSTLAPAIAGLGETGGAEDANLIVTYASHPAGKIRRAAIKALAALRAEAHVEIFLNALADELPSVSKQALKILARKTSLLSVGRVWALFSATPHLHVKRNAFSLIERFTKWESISYVVSAFCDADEDIAGRARLALDRWLGRFNRSFSAPTSEQLAKLNTALEKCGHFIDEKTRERLQFSLKRF
jgi:HEAT repeat protein